MSRSNCDTESLFATSDGRVVDGLHVDVMFSKEFVRCGFSQCGIANEDRNDMRRAGSTENLVFLEYSQEI